MFISYNYLFQLNNLAEGESLSNDSYQITTQTITSSGSSRSIVLLVVEFLPSVNLTENATVSTTANDPLNGETYTITQIIAAKPSGEEFAYHYMCKGINIHLPHVLHCALSDYFYIMLLSLTHKTPFLQLDLQYCI